MVGNELATCIQASMETVIHVRHACYTRTQGTCTLYRCIFKGVYDLAHFAMPNTSRQFRKKCL